MACLYVIIRYSIESFCSHDFCIGYSSLGGGGGWRHPLYCKQTLQGCRCIFDQDESTDIQKSPIWRGCCINFHIRSPTFSNNTIHFTVNRHYKDADVYLTKMRALTYRKVPFGEDVAFHIRSPTFSNNTIHFNYAAFLCNTKCTSKCWDSNKKKK